MRSILPLTLTAAWLGAHGAAVAVAPQVDTSSTPVAASAPGAAVAALRSDLAEIIRRPGWTDDRWSVMVVSLDRGDTLFAENAAEPLAPASNMKLFTTAAALYYLGPDFRYNTFLIATGPIRDGVLDGDLVVYGTGDPTFSSRFGNALAVWQGFADSLQALGVREIRGDVVGDGSYFEGPGAAEGWQDSYMNASYAASAGALSYAENIARLEIHPAEQAGWRPEVRLVPGGEGIAVVNQARTVAGGGTSISAQRLAYDGPVVVSGRIARGASPVIRTVPISDPARYAAAIFREVLQRAGIAVTGGIRSANTEADSPVTGRSVFAPALDSREPVRVLAVHTSPPLMRILETVNKRSHNLMAEHVLRTVGRVAVGSGSIEAGERALHHMVEREGYRTDVAMYDGSGLSILNRSSASGIIALLAMMAETPMWRHYHETLPEAGTSVGLRRMQRTSAEANLRAKTGTIDRVSALSGYVTAANGEHLAFSIISNNVPSTWMAKRVEDAMGARLAEFDRPVTPESGRRPLAREAVPETQEDAASGEPRRDASSIAGPAPAPPEPVPGEERTHTIRSGDTLDGIAKKYGTTVRAIQAANPSLNPRRLLPGTRVKVP